MNRHSVFLLATILIALGLAGCASNQGLNGPNWQSPYNAAEGSQTNTAEGSPFRTAEDSATADRLWQVFERYEGTPYRYGGTSVNGFDCSGFIATAFDEALGRKLPRTTSQMLATGETVGPGQLKVGDLVFFRIKGKDQHAGIYMGGGSFIHSSTSSGVTRSSLDGYYWRGRLSQARRFD